MLTFVGRFASSDKASSRLGRRLMTSPIWDDGMFVASGPNRIAATPSDWHFISLRRCFLSCLLKARPFELFVSLDAADWGTSFGIGPNCIIDTPSDIALSLELLSLFGFSGTGGNSYQLSLDDPKNAVLLW